MKDYYKILDVPYDASPVEIRSVYHQLAKKYHPDKNPGDAAAAALFIEIQEAYFILSDDERRQQFHLRSKYPFTIRPKPVADTPDMILNKARKLNKMIHEIDVFRVNAAIFSQAIHLLLSEQNIRMLTATGNQMLNRQIVAEMLPVCRVISYDEVLRISSKLLIVAGHDDALQKTILKFTNQKRIRRFWEKYNLIIIILATLIICLSILFLSD